MNNTTDITMTIAKSTTLFNVEISMKKNDAPNSINHHWLVGSYYGREALKAELRISFPGMQVPAWSWGESLDNHLNDMVNKLGLQNLLKPEGFLQHVRYFRFALSLGAAITNGQDLPIIPTTWQ